MRKRLWVQWETRLSLGLFVEVGRWSLSVTPFNWKWRKCGLGFKGHDDGFSYSVGPLTVERDPTGMCYDDGDFV